MIFETHIHLSDPRYVNLPQLLEKAYEQEVGSILAVSYSVQSARETLQRTRHLKVPQNIYYGFGIHPGEIPARIDDDLRELEQLLGSPGVIALGEIGLDYHYPHDKAKQKELFIRQIELANKLKLPVLIHSREAAADTYNILRDNPVERGGLMHCFSYSPEEALRFVELGYYIAFGGAITFKNARKTREAVAAVPLNRLLVETDGPYLAPDPYRGQLNLPAYIGLVVDKVAEIKGISRDDVITNTYLNAHILFFGVLE